MTDLSPSFSRTLSLLAERHPDATAIRCEEHHISWRQLDRSTNRLARAYQALGVQCDDLVNIALPNSIEFYQACLALWKLGATPQPVSSKLPRAELQAILALTESPLVVGVAPEDFPGLNTVPAAFRPDPTLLDTPLPDKVARYWKACTSGGSTGRPKIIVENAPSRLFDPVVQQVLHQRPNGVQLVTGPLYHNAPFSWSTIALLHGCQLIVMPRFEAEQALQLIQRYKVDWMGSVPTVMQRIWKLGEAVRSQYDLSSLKTVLHTAAPCPPWLKEAWINWLGGETILEVYGSTEGTGSVWITGTEWLQHKGSVGRALDGCEIQIFDEQGRALLPGQTGEVYFKNLIFTEPTYHYIGAEPAQLDGGWETFGDIGRMDAQGYLYLVDRKKDMIICGGANIFPAEVEAAIDQHPAVQSCAVIGLPDEDLGQVVHGIIHTSTAVSTEDMLAFLAERIVRYKIPRSLEFVDEPVRSDAGKVRRSQLAEERSITA